MTLPDGAVYLRLSRVDGALKCWFGPDGKRWIMTKNLAIALPDKLKVGTH